MYPIASRRCLKNGAVVQSRYLPLSKMKHLKEFKELTDQLMEHERQDTFPYDKLKKWCMYLNDPVMESSRWECPCLMHPGYNPPDCPMGSWALEENARERGENIDYGNRWKVCGPLCDRTGIYFKMREIYYYHLSKRQKKKAIYYLTCGIQEIMVVGSGEGKTQ